MLRRLVYLALTLSILGSVEIARALPAPADLKKRDQRLSAITPTPTPTPYPKAVAIAPTGPTNTVITPNGTAKTATQTTKALPPSGPTTTRVVTAPVTTTTSPARGARVVPAAATTTTRTVPAPTSSTVDNASNLAPIANTTGQTQSTIVVLDPGHGGFDRGGIAGQRVPESMMNLDVALRVRRLLQANGYRVVMTRDTDVFIPLGTRVAIGNSYRNAIFVCIHFNSASRSAANGIETYFFTQQSLSLASAIHYYVNQVAPTPNRGVRRRGFFVLRRSSIPAVLVECGFLTNPTEAQYAQNAAYRDKLAAAIVRGIQSRGSVGNAAVSSGGGAGAVPYQPFIDQTRVRDPDVGRSHHVKHSKKKSSGGSKKKKKKTDDSEE